MGDHFRLRRAAGRRFWRGTGIAAALSIAALSLAPAQAAHAATTIFVTTSAQETAVDGNCSLEEAIQAANTDTAVDACPAGSGADTIMLAQDTTYTLSSVDNVSPNGPDGLPVITSDITIEGHGAAISRSSAPGTPGFRIFYVASGASLTLDQVGESNGDSPAESNGSPGQGGAVYSLGALTITQSTIDSNKAEPGTDGIDGRGGAIYDAGTLTVTNSTILRNTASGTGGSVGGGIIVRPGSATTITSSTFSNNSGNNGSDIETEEPALTIADTIMGSGCLIEAPFTDGGHNLDAGSSCGFSGATDLSNTNPLLGPFAVNGGPTATEALLPGSPAIDAGGTCPVANGMDQRRFHRAIPCDIGAYEVQDTPITGVTAGALSSAEGQSVSGTVTTFSDGDASALGDFTATINWGDGSATVAGTVSPLGGQPGTFTVSGSHVYAEEGSFTGTVVITDADSSGTTSSRFTSAVADAALTAAGGAALNGTEGPTSLLGPGDTAPVQGAVATFTDANPAATLSDFTATIAWGDGTTSAGTISGTAGGTFSVSGSHSYREDGSYSVRVTIKDAGGATATATSSAKIADPPLAFLLLDTLEDLLGG